MDQRIEILMEEYRQPAIMVYRPYPPIGLPPINSRLGGRPTLPAELNWPRTSAGVPLHFLAQIDCAELPSNDGVLPTSGVLYFFARMDEEMIWGESGNSADDCRVLFGSLGSHETAPPADLPQALGVAGPVIDFALPEDGPIQLYPQWPVTFHRINSWPDRSAIQFTEKQIARDYQKAVRRARAAEVVRVLGLPVGVWKIADWRVSWLGDRSLKLPPSSQERPFPQLWVIIDRIARHIVKQSAAKMWPSPAKNGPDPNVLRDIETAAVDWVAKAARHRLGEAPDPAMSERFAKWLQATAEHKFFGDKVAAAIVKGMANAVQFAATDVEAAKLIPCYNDMERDHIPAFVPNPFTRPWDFGSRYHQMLGNAGSSQTARPVERDDVLLLQLKSDDGVNFKFCGAGEAEFWINKRDLAARRFDKVFATTCGD